MQATLILAHARTTYVHVLLFGQGRYMGTGGERLQRLQPSFQRPPLEFVGRVAPFQYAPTYEVTLSDIYAYTYI